MKIMYFILFVFTYLLVSTIQLPAAQKDETLFWVGGSGYWSDFFNHWTITSGGDPHDFGKVPDAGDTVYVDDNSFKLGEDVLTINIDDNAEGFTLDFSRASKKIVLIKSSAAKLRIYGSLILNPTMDFRANGEIDFESTTTGHIIQTYDNSLPNLNFNGIGGGWKLQSDLNCAAISHSYGKIETDGYTVRCLQYVSLGSNSLKEMYLSSSDIYVRANWYAFDNYAVFDAGTSNFHFSNANPNFQTNKLKYYNVYSDNIQGVFHITGNAYFNKIVINSNGIFEGNFEIDSLILTPSYEYNFLADSEQKINKLLESIGNCRAYIFLKSMNDNSKFKINSDVDCNMDFVILKDAASTGKGNISATNSIDLENNINITITGPTPRTVYWVGSGSGDWDDSANWDTDPNGSGGACLPTPYDDVIFEGLTAGDIVNVRTSTALCKSFLWNGSNAGAIFRNETNYPFSIYGSMRLSSDANYSFGNYLHFEATSEGFTIQTNNKLLPEINFNGIGGGWKLLDDLECSTINHYFGKIETDGYTVTLTQYTSNGMTYTKELYLSNSDIYVKGNWYAFDKYTVFDAGTSSIHFSSDYPHFQSTELKYYNIYSDNNQSLISLQGSCSFNKAILNSNATFAGSFEFDSLVLSANYIYDFMENTEQTINKSFDAIGNCNGSIIIKSMKDNMQFKINSKVDANIDFIIIKDFDASGIGVITATNSIDLGNNKNISISGPTPRTLYWVGSGSGYWDDSANWDTNPSGSGGACLPTPYDDVIFEGLTTGDIVNVRTSTALCRSFLWNGVNTGAKFINITNFAIRIYGSMKLSPDAIFDFRNNVNFEATSEGFTIQTYNHSLPLVNFYGIGGGWKFIDEFSCSSLYHYNGKIETGGNNLYISIYVSVGHNAPKEFYLSSSEIFVRGHWYAFDTYTVFDAGSSNIIFTGMNPSFETNKLNYYNMTTDNSQSLLTISGGGSFNKVVLNSNAYLFGAFEFDSLMLTAGYSYTLKENETQTINKHLDAKGNSCFPIFIQSSNLSNQATIFKNSDVVTCDFLSLTSINATGGATFYAGGYSKSISNNSGWLFNNAPGYIYGFGPDTILCKGDLLNTFNFNGAKSYLWHDGTTEPSHEIDISGLYWVQVTYGDNCFYSDSINIEIISNAFVDLGPDIVVCEANTIAHIKANIRDGIAPYNISWEPTIGIDNPNSSSVNISSDVSREYVMSVKSMNGCYARDTVYYFVVSKFLPIITKEGDYLVSNSKINNQWFLDGQLIPGANQQMYFPYTTGEYTLAVIDKNGCRSQTSAPYDFNIAEISSSILICGNSAGKPGDVVEIPIRISRIEDLIASGKNTISFKMRYNVSTLYPIDLIADNDQSFGTLAFSNIPIQSNASGEIMRIKFMAGLGNEEQSAIILSDAQVNPADSALPTVNGNFKLLGICPEGGNRLIFPNSQVQINSVQPNPSNGSINVNFQLSESGLTELFLIDPLGIAVKSIFRENVSEYGNRTASADLNDLPSGQYLLILKTATVVETKKVIIIK